MAKDKEKTEETKKPTQTEDSTLMKSGTAQKLHTKNREYFYTKKDYDDDVKK